MKGMTFVIIRDVYISEPEIEQCIVVTGKTDAIVKDKQYEAIKKALTEINSSFITDGEEAEINTIIDEISLGEINPYVEGEYKIYKTETITFV